MKNVTLQIQNKKLEHLISFEFKYILSNKYGKTNKNKNTLVNLILLIPSTRNSNP